jgi:hypothetical protein
MSRSSTIGHSPIGEHRHESPSPLSCWPRHKDGGWHIVVERVIEKSIARIIYPMLTHTNYTEWSVVIHVNLQVTELWEAVHYGGIEYRDDRHALAVLL